MHWIALQVIGENAIYFDSFGVEYIVKRIKEFIENKNIITNIHRMQATKGKGLSDYTNLFSPNKYIKRIKQN